MTLDIVLGGHVRWVTTERTGSIALLVDSDVVDSEVIGEIHIGPVYHLEIVGLGVSGNSLKKGWLAYSVQVENLLD